MPQIRAISFDAYGTLVELDKPAVRLAWLLRAVKCTVPVETVEKAFRDEIAYYRPRHMEGRDAASLADLRERCADVFFTALEREWFKPMVPENYRVTVLMGGIRFKLYR
ncbi:MAG: hypothetical protein ABIF71_04040 [Planctomycetota bacterium]